MAVAEAPRFDEVADEEEEQQQQQSPKQWQHYYYYYYRDAEPGNSCSECDERQESGQKTIRRLLRQRWWLLFLVGERH